MTPEEKVLENKAKERNNIRAEMREQEEKQKKPSSCDDLPF